MNNNNQLNTTAISESLVKKTRKGLYQLSKAVTKDELYDAVLHLIKEEYQRQELTSTGDTKKYLRLKMMRYEQEVFAVIFLDAQHRVLAFEEIFFGTVDACAVYSREILKRGLHYNAAAMILAHNHPSGYSLPSFADKQITKTLIQILSVVDIRVLDHIIVSAESTFSFAENGLI